MGDMAKKTASVISGLVGVATSSLLTYSAMNDLGKGAIDTNEAMFKLAGGVAGAAASGALLGSAFGTTGALIGALTGTVISGVSAWLGYSNATKENREEVIKLSNEIAEQTEKIEANRTAYEQATKSIKDSYETKLVDLEYARTMSSNLENLVDSNGKVIKGNEERVDFILNELSEALGIELERNGNLITKNGEVVGSYNELRDGISEVIQKKKEDAETEAYQELYKETIKERIKAINELPEAYEKVNEAVKRYNEERTQESAQAVLDAQENYYSLKDTVEQTTKDASMYLQKMTENTVDETKKLSNEMLKQGEVSSEYLQNMTQENMETWEKNYNQLEEETKSTMLAQSTTIENMTPELMNKWREAAEGSVEEFTSALSQTELKTRGCILSSITQTSEMTPQLTAAWAQLAKSSTIEFINQLSSLPEETQTEIMNAVTAIQDESDIMKQVWNNLGNEGVQGFKERIKALSQVANDEMVDMKDTMYNRKPDVIWVMQSIGEQASQQLNTSLNGVKSGSNYVSGVIQGINNNKELLNSTIKGLAGGAKSAFNHALGINSPSKVMEEQAQYIPLGIVKGIEKNKNRVFASMRNLSQGIEINRQDFTVDSRQFIDYGEVKGEIASKSEVNIGSAIVQKMKEAVIEGMKNARIAVQVEAKTEKGIIFKTIQQEAEEYVMQTGMNPFPVT